MRLLLILPGVIFFAWVIYNTIYNSQWNRRRMARQHVFIDPDSLVAETAMRAFRSGKPCIGSIGEDGKMKFKELE